MFYAALHSTVSFEKHSKDIHFNCCFFKKIKMNVNPRIVFLQSYGVKPACVATNLNSFFDIKLKKVSSKCKGNMFYSKIGRDLDIQWFCELPVCYQCEYYHSSSGSAQLRASEESPSLTCSSLFLFHTSSSTALL